jgi:hypothetical protein
MGYLAANNTAFRLCGGGVVLGEPQEGPHPPQTSADIREIKRIVPDSGTGYGILDEARSSSGPGLTVF